MTHSPTFASFAVAVGLGAALLSGCQGASSPGDGPPPLPSRDAGAAPGPSMPPTELATEDSPALAALRGRVWVLESFADMGVEEAALAAPQVTIGLAGDQLSGSAGCNGYSAAMKAIQPDATGQAVIIGAPIATLMACEDAAIMTQEARFLEALTQVGHVRLEASGDGDRLILEPAAGSGTVLRFGPGDD